MMNYFTKRALIFSLLFISINGLAQNIGVSTTGAIPDASAGLDISFTDKGLLVPRVALAGTNVAGPITLPATSLLVYNTATVGGANAVTPGFYYWDGTQWIRFTTATFVDTDDQTLSTNGDTLFIADGNFVVLPDQIVTLDSAYDAGGRGNGRTIIADSGAVLVQGTDGFQVLGTDGSGENLVLSGAGTRMFFYPRKSAFRTGFAAGTEWDDDSIGVYSFAAGNNVKAKGLYSTAIGLNQNVTGTAATALGVGHFVSGHVATALGGGNVSDGFWTTATGVSTLASGEKSFSMGESTSALGGWSLAGGRENNALGQSTITFGRFNNSIADYTNTFGFNLLSPSYFEFVSGRFNDTATSNSRTSWVGTERLFSLGNGSNNANRNNAFVIYKDGSGYLNGKLTLSDGTDSITFPNTDGTLGQVLETDGNGILAWSNGTDTTNFWNTNGNAGTVSTNNFVGTTDSIALTFRQNNIEKWRMEGNGTFSSLNTGNSVFIGERAGTNDDLSANRNVFIGYEAGDSNTTGSLNVAIGYQALKENSTAPFNVAVGSEALEDNKGTGNTALGHNSLKNNTTGGSNTATGMYSLLNNTSGQYNVASGNNSLFRNSVGSSNIAIGFSALQDNTNISGLVGIGERALASNIAIGNIGIGHHALDSNTIGTNNTAIGYYSMRSNLNGIDNVAFGSRTLYYNRTGSGNSAIGKGALERNNTGNYNVATGAYVLASNTMGNGNIASGYQSLFRNTTGDHNIVIGYQSLYNNTTGDYNIASGYQSLYSNITGGSNVANGFQSLYSNTTGSHNLARGFLSLYSNTTGGSNIANGVQSLYSNSSGVSNIANGYQSLFNNTTGNHNIASGYQSLFSNTTGSSNVANSFQSLYRNTTGISNVAMGYQSLYNNTTGDSNTALGFQSGVNISTGSRNIIIGSAINAPSATASNQLNIGNIIFGENIDGTGAVISSGNIGIGVSAPTAKIDVNGTTRIRTLPGGDRTDQVVTADVNGNIRKVPIDSINKYDWSVFGNDSTIPGTAAGQNYLGTTGNTDMVIATNDSVQIRLISMGASANAGDVIQSKLNGIIYIDGTRFTKNRQGIVDAVDALPATGGKIILPEGTYSIPTTLNITKSNVIFEGIGTATILESSSTTASIIKIVAENLTIKNLVVKYDVVGTAIAQKIIEIDSSSNITIDNCMIEKGFYGIYSTTNNERCRFINNNMDSNYSHVHAIGKSTIISHNHFGVSQGSGFSAGCTVGGTNSICSNNTFSNFSGTGARVAGNHNVCSNNTFSTTVSGALYSLFSGGNYNIITSNTILDCEGTGIWVAGTYNSVSKNTIRNTTSHGIQVYNGYNNQIDDNTIYGAGDTTTEHGILVYCSNGINIRNNRVDSSYGHNIFVNHAVACPCNYIIISNNYVRDARGDGIKINAASNYPITGNLSYNNAGFEFSIYGTDHTFIGNNAGGGTVQTSCTGCIPATFNTMNKVP